jgi:hypothetical protein
MGRGDRAAALAHRKARAGLLGLDWADALPESGAVDPVDGALDRGTVRR